MESTYHKPQDVFDLYVHVYVIGVARVLDTVVSIMILTVKFTLKISQRWKHVLLFKNKVSFENKIQEKPALDDDNL